MDESKLKLYVMLAYIALVTALVLVFIDFKLKADTVRMLTGGSDGPGTPHSHSNWNSVRFADHNIPAIPNARFAPRVEEASDNGQVPAATESASELGNGEGNTEFQEGDQSL